MPFHHAWCEHAAGLEPARSRDQECVGFPREGADEDVERTDGRARSEASAVDGLRAHDEVARGGAVDDVGLHAIEPDVEELRDALLDGLVGHAGVEPELERREVEGPAFEADVDHEAIPFVEAPRERADDGTRTPAVAGRGAGGRDLGGRSARVASVRDDAGSGPGVLLFIRHAAPTMERTGKRGRLG